MMQLFGALCVFMTLSTACGLRCFACIADAPNSCTGIKSCEAIFNRCYTMKPDGLNMVSKGCLMSLSCQGSMECCEGDLCNGAPLQSPSVVLVLLVSSTAIALFR